MKRSLTSQLFFGVTPIVVAMLALIGGIAFLSCQHEINEVDDEQMANNAHVLWALVKEDLSHVGSDIRPVEYEANDLVLGDEEDTDDVANGRMFRIWRGSRIVMQSDTAFDALVGKFSPGYHDVSYEQVAWRVFAEDYANGAVVIEIGEKQALRNELIGKILLDLFLPLIGLVPLIGAALWIGIRRGMRPMQALVRQIRERSPDDLTAIEAEGMPRDLLPLGQSINKLFSKLTQSISAERRFTDHAAHQLRTPLAGEKLLIQMLKDGQPPEEHAAILADLEASNERASLLVQKLLTMARVSHQPLRLEAITLSDAAARTLAALGPIADKKAIELSLAGDQKAAVRADETLLSLILANLIENAIKYAPAGSAVHLEVRTETARVGFELCDAGPGIADAERERVFHRFYRVEESEEGSGLGLAIVKECLNRLGGSITLDTPPAGVGLRVTVWLPTA